VAGKVTVGLASHWSCVTDSWYTTFTYKLNGLGKEDEHAAYASVKYGTFTFTQRDSNAEKRKITRKILISVNESMNRTSVAYFVICDCLRAAENKEVDRIPVIFESRVLSP